MTVFPLPRPFEPAPDEQSVVSLPCIYHMYDSHRKHDLIDLINRGLIDESINRPSRYGTTSKLRLSAKRTFHIAIIAADLEYGFNAFHSSLSLCFKDNVYSPLKAWHPSNFQCSAVISDCKFAPSSTVGLQTSCFHLPLHALSHKVLS